MTETGTYVGIDVAKANIDIAVRPTGRVWQAPYNATGIAELVAQIAGPERQPRCCRRRPVGWKCPWRQALATAALPVVVVNPRQVCDFARATGQSRQDR